MKQHTEARVFMNTTISLTAWTNKDTYRVYDSFESAFRQFTYVVDTFSRFKRNSELSKLNRSGGKWFKTSPELFSLIYKAVDIANQTDGAFDPTIIDLLEMYGYDKSYDFKRLDHRKKLENEIASYIKTRPTFHEIDFDFEAERIKLKKNQRIDLGSIGKGYAVDLASEFLEPLDNYLIEAGGDIKVFGKNKQGNPWEIDLAIPGKKPVGELRISEGSVASSGKWARQVDYFHHLLNPRDGKPVNDSVITFTHAPSAIDADAWSTALFVTGKRGLQIIEDNGVQGTIVVGDKFHETSGFPRQAS